MCSFRYLKNIVLVNHSVIINELDSYLANAYKQTTITIDKISIVLLISYNTFHLVGVFICLSCRTFHPRLACTIFIRYVLELKNPATKL